MATLDEYLAGILVSLNRARVMADIQTVDTAEKYARHELLRHFAVPRMRFSDVELSIPVALEALLAGGRGGVTPDERDGLRKQLLDQMPRLLGVRSLPQGAIDAIGARIDAEIDRLDQALPHAAFDEAIGRFGGGLADQVLKAIEAGEVKASRDRIDHESIAGAFRAEAARAIPAEPAGPGASKLEVVAEAHKLREQRPSDVITIKLTVNEDGVEWQRIERSDGTIERKLLPE